MIESTPSVVTILYLLLVILSGMVLGLFYFGTLWITVRYLPRLRRPELVLAVSFVLRTAITVLGFYLVMGGQWMRLLACMVGFILVQVIFVCRFGSQTRFLPTK
jgi:F1F0 ATPase subunit 2